MRHILSLGAVLAIGVLVGSPSQAGSASMLAGAKSASPRATAQKVGWARCELWADKCARRWGPGTWRFGRCMWRHSC